MIKIILSLDYEIYGNGKGDVIEHIINPTSNILEICDKYSVPLSIMFEINEFLKFKEYKTVLKDNLGYSPTELIKKQLISAIKGGHDVQLHTHPQWLDAKYVEGKWILKDPQRNVNQLTDKQIQRFISTGKRAIENLIRDYKPDYRCTVLRLTNLNWKEAPKKVIPAMIDNSIYIHSLSTSNNTKNNSQGYWPLEPKGKVIEVPIHSVEVPKYKIYTNRRVRNVLYRRKYQTKGDYRNVGKVSSPLSFLYGKHDLKWDFCNQTAEEMLDFLYIAMKNYNHKNEIVPLVMIGHSKDFDNSKELLKFLGKVKNIFDPEQVDFSTFRDLFKN